MIRNNPSDFSKSGNLLSLHAFLVALIIFIGMGCGKESPNDSGTNNTDTTNNGDGFKPYLIRQGQHYCDQNTLKLVRTSEMRFAVRFDSSAIYTTVNPVNQFDINKLWGFSEGLNHQVNSARIGWRWSDSALRLFGYVYDSGQRYSQEIGIIEINRNVECGIKLMGDQYAISANGDTVFLPRGPLDTVANGYQLYPYFGGDETAPQDIRIMVREY
jgi:hypothetical protein